MSPSGSALVTSPANEIACPGCAEAPWPASTSFGRASTETQLIDYVTRAAAAAAETNRAPAARDWVAVKVEDALSSEGGGGYMFGPPDERRVSLQWFRVDGCASTSPMVVPSDLSPVGTLTGKLTIYPATCDQGDLAGWKSYSYQYLNSLPTDPAALESVILANDPPGGYIPDLRRDQSSVRGR